MLTKILNALLQLIGIQGAKAAIDKAILYTLFTVVLPVVLWNLLYKLLEFYMGKMTSFYAGEDAQTIVGFALEASGMFAWALQEAYIPLCLALLVSAVSLRFTLNAMQLRP